MGQEKNFWQMDSQTIVIIILPLILNAILLAVSFIKYLPLNGNELLYTQIGNEFSLLSTLGWFYLSVLAAGFSALYSHRQFLAFISYVIALTSFIVLTGNSGNILAPFFVSYLLVYGAALFIMKFFVQAEIERNGEKEATVYELSLMLLPLILSASYIVAAFLSTNREVITVSQLFFSVTFVLSAGYGIIAGSLSKIPVSLTILTLLSLLSLIIIKNSELVAFWWFFGLSGGIFIISCWTIVLVKKTIITKKS